MAKSSKRIVWKSANDQTRWRGFVNGTLRFSLERVRSGWSVSVLDRWGFFCHRHDAQTAAAAKEWAAASL